MSDRKRKGRVLTTPAEMKQAVLAAREREKTATKIRHVNYEPGRDALVVDLSTGVTLVVPRSLIPGFAKASPASVADVSIDPGSESLWSETVDDGVLLEQLVQIAAGDELLQVLGGRIAGRRRSPAKSSAARTNGAKGGRPPLEMTTFLNHLERKLHELVPDAPAMDGGNRGDGENSRAHWQNEAGVLLEVEASGRNRVEIVRAAWPVKRSSVRRIRTSAEHLARDFARCLAERKRREAHVHTIEQTVLSHHARARKHASAGRRRSAARRG